MAAERISLDDKRSVEQRQADRKLALDNAEWVAEPKGTYQAVARAMVRRLNRAD